MSQPNINDLIDPEILNRIKENPSNNLGQKRKSFLEENNKNLTPRVDKSYILITPKSSLKKNMHLTQELYIDSLLKHPIAEEYEKRIKDVNSRRTLNFQDNHLTKKISNFDENFFNSFSNGEKKVMKSTENNKKDLFYLQNFISDSSDNEGIKTNCSNSAKKLKENKDPEEKGTQGKSEKEEIHINKSIPQNHKKDKNEINKMLNFFENYHKDFKKKENFNSIISDSDSNNTNNWKDNKSDKDNDSIESQDKNKSGFNNIIQEENESNKNDHSFNPLEKSISFGAIDSNNENNDSRINKGEKETEEKKQEIEDSVKKTPKTSDLNNDKNNVNLLLKLNSNKKENVSGSNKKGFLFDSDYLENSDTRKNCNNKLKIIDPNKPNKDQYSLFDSNPQKKTNNSSTKKKIDLINYDSEAINKAIRSSQESFKNKCQEIKLSDYKIHKGGGNLTKSKK